MKIIVVGHGMVGHKFLEELHQLNLPHAEVSVLCEEPRPAYDRVHLSEFFAGKSAEDLSLVAPRRGRQPCPLRERRAVCRMALHLGAESCRAQIAGRV